MSDRSIPPLDRVTDAFFAVDDHWRFTYCNRAAARLLGATRGEVVGRVLWDEFPEIGVSDGRVPTGFYRAMQHQEPTSVDLYLDGPDAWYEARAYPDESGLSVYLRNVTDRKERETDLAQHAAVVEAMHDAVVTLDGDHHVVSVNPSLEEVLGVDGDRFVGEHVDAVVRAASIDDEDAFAIGRAIDEVAAGDTPDRSLEVGIDDRDGRRRVTEVRMVPIDDDVASLAAIVRDVSDQREYERVVTSLHEVTRWLLESTDPAEICAIAVHSGSDLLDLPITGIWLLDEEHGYLDPVAGTAGAHEEFGGLPRLYPGDGLAWDVFEAGDPSLFDDLAAVDGLLNPDTTVRSEVIVPIGTHGLLMAGSLEPNRFDETDLELISTLTENTRASLDRAERERVLRERTERLERQTERLEAVATVLSEDLKGDLQAVADALEEGATSVSPDDWEFPFADDSARETLDRAERLVDDVRAFARNATSVGSRQRVDLEAAVADAADAATVDAASVSIETPATLRADPDRFRYLLESIFDDAAARSAGGDPTVRVCLLDRSDGSRGFYVVDDADRRPSVVWEDDEVVDPADRLEGFGLAVARTIAESHGWSVSVSAGDRGGTRFAVREITTLERQP